MKPLSNSLQTHNQTSQSPQTKYSNWMLQHLKQGIQTLELSFGLLAEELKKRRSPQQHIVVSHILGDVEIQLQLLIQQQYAPENMSIHTVSNPSHYSRNVASLNRLDSRYYHTIDRITLAYLQFVKKLNGGMGLSVQMNNIRAAFGMEMIG